MESAYRSAFRLRKKNYNPVRHRGFCREPGAATRSPLQSLERKLPQASRNNFRNT